MKVTVNQYSSNRQITQVKVVTERAETGEKGVGYRHALVLEESDGARLDGFLGRARAGLADLLLVPG